MENKEKDRIIPRDSESDYNKLIGLLELGSGSVLFVFSISHFNWPGIIFAFDLATNGYYQMSTGEQRDLTLNKLLDALADPQLERFEKLSESDKKIIKDVVSMFSVSGSSKIAKSARASQKIITAPKANLRQLYTDEVAGLEKVGKDLLAAGKSEAEVAKTLVQMRRDLGVKYKDMTPPDLLEYLYKFNEARNGDKLGPTYEWFKAQLKTDAQIIAGASKPLGDMKQLGAALHKHFGDMIAPILRKYGMLD